jgi:hypothetical protein
LLHAKVLGELALRQVMLGAQADDRDCNGTSESGLDWKQISTWVWRTPPKTQKPPKTRGF